MLAHRYLVGLLFLCQTASAYAAAPQEAFARDLAAAREEAAILPAESLRRLEALKAGRSGRELGYVLADMSPAYYWLGDKKKAVDTALHAEKLGRAAHDDVLLATAMLHRGAALSNINHDQEAAHRLIEGAARLADNTSDTSLQARAALAQGLLAEEDGRSADGIEFVARAVALARAAPDPAMLSAALREHARLLAGIGSYREALALTDELLAIAASRGAPQLAQARLSEYATAARAGQSRRAEKALRAAVDLLETLHAKERLALPLANLAELYIQARRYGEAARASESALRIARELGDENAARLASFQLGITNIYLRNIANGRKTVDRALDALKNDDRYVRMLLDYGHALNRVGEGDAALTVYEKAGAVSLAAWRKEKQLSTQALQQALAYQKKQNELAALHHEGALKASELETVRRVRSLWVLLSVTTLVAVALIALLYRRVAGANKALQAKNAQLFRQSTRDSLTGLFNRHYFYEHVVPRHHASAGAPAGGVFLLLDIDHFKSINDRFGHSAGDVVLKNVAARLAAGLREEDVLIRWGGEEFLAYLPGVGVDVARQVCARLLAAVSATPIAVEGRQLTVTTSIGFCPKPAGGMGGMGPGWEQLVHLADLCLYLAKTAGRQQAFGISDANALTAETLAAADADLHQACADGLVELLNVKTPAAKAPA